MSLEKDNLRSEVRGRGEEGEHGENDTSGFVLCNLYTTELGKMTINKEKEELK